MYTTMKWVVHFGLFASYTIHMIQVISYIKNSADLIKTYGTLKIPQHSLLVTLDVESLYSNVTHEQAIYTITWYKPRVPKRNRKLT